MLLNIILIIIIVSSLALILSIIFKKLPQLKRVDPEKITEYKEKNIKKELIEKRLIQDLDSSKRKLSSITKPILSTIYDYLKKFYNYIYDLEEKYRQKLIKTHFEDKISSETETIKHLEVADEFIKEKEYTQAENEYIEALKLDVHNLDIYKKLANLYFDNKDYDKAQETYEYIIKLSPQNETSFTGKNDDYVYNRLGDIFTIKGDLNQAIINYQKAVELKDNNPIYYYNLSKTNLKLKQFEQALENVKKALNIEPDNSKLLDFLLDLSIIMGDKELANKTLNKLIAINPDNKKIPGARDKINQI
jgi:tetratricopeptide (TPR) repeat protein